MFQCWLNTYKDRKILQNGVNFYHSYIANKFLIEKSNILDEGSLSKEFCWKKVIFMVKYFQPNDNTSQSTVMSGFKLLP